MRGNLLSVPLNAALPALVYPRVCGETTNAIGVRMFKHTEGLSPRVRGNLSRIGISPAAL